MIEDACVSRPETFGLLDCFGGLSEQSLLEQTPRQRVISKYILAGCVFALHNFQRCIEMRVVVRPEQSQLPRIKCGAAGVLAQITAQKKDNRQVIKFTSFGLWSQWRKRGSNSQRAKQQFTAGEQADYLTLLVAADLLSAFSPYLLE